MSALMPASSLSLGAAHAVFSQPQRLISLDQIALRKTGIVQAVNADSSGSDWAQRLAEIGFIKGESVCLMARGPSPATPLVVRIGDSTFALRPAEAACIMVQAIPANQAA